MRLVHPNCEAISDNPIIDYKEPFLAFDCHEDVLNFTPRLTKTYPSDAQYVVCRKGAFKKDTNGVAKKVLKSSPRNVIFWDASCKTGCCDDFLKMCDKYVYMKKNISIHTPSAEGLNFVPAPETIPDRFAAFLATKDWSPIPSCEKPLDVCFIGAVSMESRQHRKQQAKIIKAACKKLGLNHEIKFISSKDKVHQNKYASIMRQSKICPSLKGLGYRCRREWEVLSLGSVLMMDRILLTDQLKLVDIEPEKHFVFQKENVLEQLKALMDDNQTLDRIANDGHALYMKTYGCKGLDLSERFLRIYLLRPDLRLLSLSDVENAEREIGLG